ncbi:hypothetical protein GCM10022221_64910 [Actinocorallia aurea]
MIPTIASNSQQQQVRNKFRRVPPFPTLTAEGSPIPLTGALVRTTMGSMR